MKLIDCSEEHIPDILEILNECIINSTALYDYNPRTLEDAKDWFQKKNDKGFPILGLLNIDGILAGFASYDDFRHFPAYKYTIEHCIYVHKNFRGLRLGDLLLGAIIERAEKGNYHTIIGAIDSSNKISIKLHQNHGFEECGLIKEAGYKFGKWLDVAFMQKILKTPENPEED